MALSPSLGGGSHVSLSLAGSNNVTRLCVRNLPPSCSSARLSAFFGGNASSESSRSSHVSFMITECFVVYLPAGRGLSGVDSSNGGRSTRGGGGGGGNARSNQRGGRGQKSVVQPNGLVSRRFGFVGFSTAEECARAHAYFDGAFMDTYRLKLEPARAKDEHAAAYDANSAERPWSKYSEGSSANREMKRKQTKEGSEYNDAAAAAADDDDDDGKTNKKKAKKAQHVFTDEELAKDPKLREFLALASNK